MTKPRYKTAPLKLIIILLTILSLSNSKQVGLTRIQRSVKLGQASCTTAQGNNQTQIGLGNCYQDLYVVTLGIGTPPQSFIFQFDTGSNILWIPTVQGYGSGFNTTASSTFQQTSNQNAIYYGDGSSVSGLMGTDVVTVSGTAISVTNSILWVSNQSSGVQPSAVQGLVGMGYTTTPNFIDLAYQLNQINNSNFALGLSTNSTNSILYYDQIPQNIVDGTTMLPVIGNEYWEVSVIGFYSGTDDVTNLAGPSAIIDSGTSYLQVSQSLFNYIQGQYFGNCSNFLATPQCPCSDAQNWPKFTIMFQGLQVYIYPENYTRTVSIGQTTFCTYDVGSIAAGNQGPNMILGDIFFRNYVVSFSKTNSSLGFYGQTDPVELVGGNFFLISQYIMLALIAVLLLFSAYLAYVLRINKSRGNKELSLYLLEV